MKKASRQTRRADKIQRNELCPCGSDLKYKKCCLPKKERLMRSESEPPPIPIEVLERAKQKFHEHQKQEQERVSRFGAVMPVIAAKAFGKQIVGVGNKLLASSTWRHFRDFLWD